MSALIDAEPGQHVADFAKELAALAKLRQCLVHGRHNGRYLAANPHTTAQELLAQWSIQDPNSGDR